MTSTDSREPAWRAALAISPAFRIAIGVSIIAQSFMASPAPACRIAADARSMSSPLAGFGSRIASGPAATAARRSSAPHGVSRPLMRMTISRGP